MMSIFLRIGIFILNVCYAVLKLFPTKQKICLISRQGDVPPVDFEMLVSEIAAHHPEFQTVVLSKMLRPGALSGIRYLGHMFRQMYHIATSKVVVLDSYCIAVSVLRHKKSLTVIQMWHAIGLLKKAGFALLGLQGGRDPRVAKVMNMHGNYDYICASADACRKSMGAVFGYEPDSVIVNPLPRVDLLRDEKYMDKVAEEIQEYYPELHLKKTILFAPTHRKDESVLQMELNNLIELIDFDRYNLIVKPHPLSNLASEDKRVLFDRHFESVQIATISDAVIIDYSSLLFEVAILRKPIYFFTFDLSEYLDHVGFFVDFENEIPGEKFLTARETMNSIENNEYNPVEMRAFLDKYVDPDKTDCTTALANFITKNN
jgi:CDP-ribitol ribitolphosphotransferase